MTPKFFTFDRLPVIIVAESFAACMADFSYFLLSFMSVGKSFCVTQALDLLLHFGKFGVIFVDYETNFSKCDHYISENKLVLQTQIPMHFLT